MTSKIILVYVTTSSFREAERIAERMVAERLAACANILGRIRSVYRWRGKVARSDEWLLLLKTQKARWPQLEIRIKELHSYEVPCIVALPIEKGYTAFLTWIESQTRCARPVTERKRTQ